MDEERIITNKEKEEAIKRCLGQEAKMIDIDDTFDFECQQCGQCCMNRQDIILNPFDIYQIAKHENKTPKEIMEQYLIADLGRDSRLPMVLLNCDMENHWCPFLKFDAADGCKFKCTIHDCSPGACQNHPIGAMFAYGQKETLTFCKVEQCDNSKGHNHLVKVRDYVARYIDNQEEIDVAHQIQTLMLQYLRADEFMIITSYMEKQISLALENKPDDVTPEQVLTMKRMKNIANSCFSGLSDVTINIGYLNYDTSKPFIEQAQANMAQLRKFYSNMKEMYEKFKNLLGVPDDVDDVKRWMLHDSIEKGIIDTSSLPKEFIDMVKDKVGKGEI